MADLNKSRITLMREWLDAKAASRQSAEDRKRDAESRKAEAWELWKVHAVDANSTLLELLDGRKPKDWPAEKTEAERKLFEEFWAEQAA